MKNHVFYSVFSNGAGSGYCFQFVSFFDRIYDYFSEFRSFFSFFRSYSRSFFGFRSVFFVFFGGVFSRSVFTGAIRLHTARSSAQIGVNQRQLGSGQSSKLSKGEYKVLDLLYLPINRSSVARVLTYMVLTFFRLVAHFEISGLCSR